MKNIIKNIEENKIYDTIYKIEKFNKEWEWHKLYIISWKYNWEDIKHLLRVKKIWNNNSIEKEYIILKFMQENNLSFIPTPIFYNKEKWFMIEKFIDWEEIPLLDFNKEQIDFYIKQTYAMFDLKTDNFIEFCKKYNYDYFDIIGKDKSKKENLLNDIKTYWIDVFKKIDKNKIWKKNYNILEKKLNKNIEYVNSIKEEWWKNKKLRWLVWWDIQSTVIVKNNKMYFFDFEYAWFWHNVSFSYLWIHWLLNNKKKLNEFIEKALKYENKTKKDILFQIASEEKITRVNDVMWAGMMYSETDDNKYLDIFNERLNLII